MAFSQIPQFAVGHTPGNQNDLHHTVTQQMALSRHIRVQKPIADGIGAGHKEVVEIHKEFILAAAATIALENKIGRVHLQSVSLIIGGVVIKGHGF